MATPTILSAQDYRQTLAHRGYLLSPVTAADQGVVLAIFATTPGMAQVLASKPEWPAAEQLAFLQQQSFFQETAYRGPAYAGACLDLVRWQGTVVGRIYVLMQPGVQARLMEITLLPAYRNQGHGANLITALLAQARQEKIPVTAMVEDDNPARTLYTRLGFAPTGETHSFYRLWQWRPPARNTPQPCP